jgi:hypothetical protein
MTARTQTIIVALDKEYRDDDIEDILKAINLLKGVLKAEILESNHGSQLNGYGYKQQIKKECYELMKKIWEEW